MTPAAAAEEFFARVSNMAPSKSSLDRLPKQLLMVFEDKREAFEAALRKDEIVPEAPRWSQFRWTAYSRR